MKGITVDMTGIVFFLLLTGVVFMVGSADIKKIKLYLPSSLAEQKAIADILYR